jgi:hypothetical protein
VSDAMEQFVRRLPERAAISRDDVPRKHANAGERR